MAATLLDARPAPALGELLSAAVLAQPCDGYPRGTTGRITGRHQGCVVFAPDQPESVARWAAQRTRITVPTSFIAE